MFDQNVSVVSVKGNVASHRRICKGSSLVQNVTLSKVGNDIKLEVDLKKDLPHGVYSYDFDIVSDFASGFNIYMYGDCGGAGFDAKTLYRYWARNYSSGQQFNPVKQNNVNGG